MTTHADPAVARRDMAAVLGPQRITIDPWGIKVGPFRHLTAERLRLEGLSYDGFTVEPVGSTLGGEIRGLDLRQPLDPVVRDEVARALADFKVLFFRDQPIDQAQHVAFASSFGELEVHPFLPSNTGFAELVRFEKEAKVGGFENAWHHDVTWRANPSMGAVLHGIEVPRVGGDTLFSDMHAAYDGLDDGVKARIEGLVATHDFTRGFGAGMDREAKRQMQERYPPVTHPVVHRHPVTGMKLIYVNRYFVTGIVGLDQDESDALVDTLCREAELVEYQVRFHWERDSIAFWDNRAVQHYAASDYYPATRIMERASIVGGRPE